MTDYVSVDRTLSPHVISVSLTFPDDHSGVSQLQVFVKVGCCCYMSVGSDASRLTHVELTVAVSRQCDENIGNKFASLCCVVEYPHKHLREFLSLVVPKGTITR